MEINTHSRRCLPRRFLIALSLFLGLCYLVHPPIASAQNAVRYSATDFAPPAKIARYADIVMKHYDLDRNGMLTPAEWSTMPGTPQAIDINGDGQITKEELLLFMVYYGQSRTIHRTLSVNLSAPYQFDASNLRLLRPFRHSGHGMESQIETENPRQADDIEVIMLANEQPLDEDVYLKLQEKHQVPADRPYHVLPERLHGVPAWFIIVDRDGDGQVSLLEFTPTLDPRLVNLFKQLDTNSNGFIEPNEIR